MAATGIRVGYECAVTRDDDERCVQLTIETFNREAEAFRERFYARRVADHENRDVKAGVTMFVRQLLKHVSRRTILDLGCGPGEHAQFVARATRSPVVGVDGAEAMLRLARRHCGDIRLARMDVRRLGFKNEAFDAILASFIVNHVPRRQLAAFCREVWRVARPDCVLYIVATESAEQVDAAREGGQPPRVSYALTCTGEELSDAVTRAGFRVGKVHRSPYGRVHLMAVKPAADVPCSTMDV